MSMLHTTSTAEVPIWSHLLLIIAILVAGFLMFWLSGGFPPNTWRLLLQILPQIQTLWTQRGPAIFFPLLILSVQSLLLGIAWIGILWAAIREVSALVATLKTSQPRSLTDTGTITQSSQASSLLPLNPSQATSSFLPSDSGVFQSAQRKTPSLPIGQSLSSPRYVLPRMDDEVVQQPYALTKADTMENPFDDHARVFEVPSQSFTSSYKSQVLAPSFALENPFDAQENMHIQRPLDDIGDPEQIEERKAVMPTAPLKPLESRPSAENPFTQVSTTPDKDIVYVFGNPFETQQTLPPAAMPLSAQKTAPLFSPTLNAAPLPLPSPAQKTPSFELTMSNIQPNLSEARPILELSTAHIPSAFDVLLSGVPNAPFVRTDIAVSSSQVTSQEQEELLHSAQRAPSPPVVVKSNPHRASALTHVGIKRANKPNEDAHQITTVVRTLASGATQPVSLLLIADGMGGHGGGEYASSLVIETVRAEIEPLLTNSDTSIDDFKICIVNAAHHANTRLFQENETAGTFRGTTLTGAIIIGQPLSTRDENDTAIAIAHIVNVGDSRTYRHSATQGLNRITHDHSIVEELVSQHMITDDERYTDSRRNEIYRCLGEKQTIDVDVFTVSLQPRDRLLLCSDGLWEMVRDRVLATLLSVPLSDPSLIASILLQSALEGGGKDNITLIVALLPESIRKDQW